MKSKIKIINRTKIIINSREPTRKTTIVVFQKEPVEFDTSHLRGAPAEVEALVHNIKEVAQQFLYHWRTFPIVLPPSLSSCTEGEDTLARKKYHLRDLFVAPSFDELDAVAVDSKGEPRRLTNKQLESIRERG